MSCLYGAMLRPTPCRRHPTAWDADKGTPFEMIRELVRLCRTECPAFAACAKYAETKPQVTGVLAGQYIRTRTDGRWPRPSMPNYAIGSSRVSSYPAK